MKKFLFILLFLPLCSIAQVSADVLKYIEQYKEVAIKEMLEYKIPASITLAQGIHESSWGKSKLSLNSNNHFGIKCHKEWCGPTYKHDDDAPQECFRVYERAEDSYKDHSAFLKTRPRYSFLFDLDPKDYKGWARGLKSAGYATNPNYPSIIIKLIEDYKLYELDRAIDTLTTPSPKLEVSIPTSVPIQKKEISLTRVIVNGRNAVLNDGNATLDDIAQKFNLTKEKLYEWNDRVNYHTPFKKDENIFIEEKKEDCEYQQYVLEEGETLLDVSQKFGIKLDALCKRNNVNRWDVPTNDEVIVLRGTREYPIHLKNRTTSSEKPTNISNVKYHTVDTKDTLFSISQKYNVSLQELKKWNKLSNSAIKVGQRLRVSL
jgi:LysM repeat protein